jgi:hypothetical protein
MAINKRFVAKNGLDNDAKSISNLGVTGSSLTLSGANAITLTSTGTTGVTLPLTGTLATLAENEALTNKTVNRVTITTPATGSTLTIADGKTLTASNTLTFTGTDSSSVAFGSGGTVAYTANKLSAFAATTSAELAGVISDETGSGGLVFGTSPTFTTGMSGSATFSAFASSTDLTVGYTGVSASTTNIVSGINPTGVTKIVNIATGGDVGSTTNVNIGGGNGGTTTINRDLKVLGNTVLDGNLTVKGNTTTVSSLTLEVLDANIELAKVASPTDITANGAGITVKGTTDKTIIWDSTNSNWTSSEHWNLVSSKVFKINNIEVLSSTKVLGVTPGGSSAGDLVTINATQTLTNKTISGANNTLSNIANSSLTNSSITINGSAVSLGGSVTVSATATAALTISSPLNGTSYNGSTAATIALASGYGDTQNPYASKTQKYVLAAPNAADGVPTFRALLASDIPTLNQNTTGTAGSITSQANSATITATSANTANQIVLRDASGNFTAGSITTTGRLQNAGGLKTYSVSTVGQDNVNAVHEIMKISRDGVNWSNNTPYEITVYSSYYTPGGCTKWLLSYGHFDAGTLTCTYAGGSGQLRVYLGTEVTVSAGLQYRPVLVDLPPYMQASIEVRYSTTEVASVGAINASSQVFFSNVTTASGGTGNFFSGSITVGTIGTGTWQGSAIADTYLSTISTAGKVSNSATTATSTNTASAIVARDASGNFSAGTITAALTGNVTGNVTGSSGSTTGNAATVTNGFYTTSSFNLGTTSIAVNRTSATQSLTGINIDGSSGSCTGNAATATLAANSTLAGGLAVASGRNNGANQIVRTDASGYLQTGYINSSNGDEGNNSNPSRVWGTNGSDSYLRTYLTSALSVSYATSAGGITSQANSATITATSANTANQIVLRDASGNFSAGVMSGTATTARYADLAENYVSDQQYDYGIVLMIGGDEEVTMATEDTQRLAGVVSQNPAYLMNSECEGKHVVAIALQGRTPVRVIGKVNKGDFLVSAGDGYAKATDNPRIGSIIGKSLESFDGQYGMVEAMVGRL